MADKVIVRVLFDYSYTPKDSSSPLSFKRGDEFFLQKKSNEEWWSVYKAGSKPVYVPANYVEIIDKKVKKKVPPKPPKVPPKPPKPLEPDNVLKDLDDMLDNVLSDQTYLGDLEEGSTDIDSISLKDEKSDTASLTMSTPDEDGSSSVDNLSGKEDRAMASSSDSLDVRERHDPAEAIYANTQEIRTNSVIYPKTTASLDRNFASKFGNHYRSSSLTSALPATNGSSDGSRKIPVPQPRLTGKNYIDEEPCYANLQELQKGAIPESNEKVILEVTDKPIISRVPPPRPTGPKPQISTSSQHVNSFGTPTLLEGFGSNNKEPGEKWFRSTDEAGQVYYFKDGTNESAWDLPESPSAVREVEEDTEGTEVFDYSSNNADDKLAKMPPHTRIREMQTYLNRSKVAEDGKRVKKNWSQAYVITTGPLLYFYKDQKSSQPKPNLPLGKPEVQLELRGASVIPAPKEYTSKKNVILISTKSGVQFLLHSDEKAKIQDWYNTIAANIALLGNQGGNQGNQVSRESFLQPDNQPGSPRLQKSRRSTKKSSSTLERPTTPDDTLCGPERNLNIKHRLLYWLLRRPTAESLKERGIIKDGIFGSHLQSICDREMVPVPRFVTHCVNAVNSRGLDVDGIYRISGNMATIQKIRFQVDQNEPYDLMNPEVDVHDISGALKLFFRELQEPLFPFNLYEKFTRSSQILDKRLKLKAFQDTVRELPKVNYDCMKEVILHLRRVMENSRKNRMEAQNIAIVFGPTLMRSIKESCNMAADLVMQGQIVEYILLECKSIFQ